MLSVAVAAIGLVLFFSVVLYFCVREPKRETEARRDSNLEIMRKSPFGRWRY